MSNIILTIPSYKKLATAIGSKLGIAVHTIKLGNFADGELFVRLPCEVYAQKVFIIMSVSYPVNRRLMQLLILANALKAHGAQNITVIIPYLAYMRQDRITKDNSAITARLIADLLQSSGIDRLVTVELHSVQTQGFFNIPVMHISGVDIMFDYWKDKINNSWVVASPDIGGAKRAHVLANKLGVSMIVVDKQRTGINKSSAINIIGNVAGKNVIIYDDIIDTGGTVSNAASLLLQNGANQVVVCAAHGLFNNNAIEKIKQAGVNKVVVTNSIEKSHLNDVTTVDISGYIVAATKGLFGI